MTTAPWRLVTVDIDGTLTTGHGWQFLARRFGREEQFEALTRRFRAGEIGEDENLSGLLELAEGKTLAEVESVLAATPKLREIPEGVARLHEAGLRVALLTHNPPYVTDWYRRFAHFDDAAGQAGRQPVGEVVGPPIDIRADKVGGLQSLQERLGVRPPEIVHVGDGRPDAVIFALVGRGIALNSRQPAVNRAAHRALTTTNFQDVVDAVLDTNV